MGIVWLASYPKSGNTWLRFMLYHLLHGRIDDSAKLNRRIPDIHRREPFEPPASGPIYAKSHLMFSAKHPKAEETERAVVVLRRPQDVALSALNYRRMTGSIGEDMTDAAYVRTFMATGGDPGYAQMGMGTWGQHARSWTGQERFPVLVTRYEAFKADAAAELARVAEFCSIDATAERLAAAAKASSFENMRALEVREKAADRKGRLWVGDKQSLQKGRLFMNAGKTGQSLDDIEPGLDAAFTDAMAEPMKAFGYAD